MSMTAEIVTRDGKHLLEFPAGFDVRETEVSVHRDSSTGDIIPSSGGARAATHQAESWERFRSLLDEVPADERASFELQRDTAPPVPRDLG